MNEPAHLTVDRVEGIPEVTAGADLAGLLRSHADLRDGDVVVVTSKVVSKAEGRTVVLAEGLDRADVLAAETDRVVARRGGTSIVRTRHGLVMAAAGVDASNTAPGTLVLLPVDPDASARALREALAIEPGGGTGPNVAVLVSDTSGRAWRNGQTDIAVGCAGLAVLDDHAGRRDGYGNDLVVTAPAVADEVTAAADLVTGKLSRSPAAVVRGLSGLVLPPGEHGPGAGALVRPEATDMFGLGAREAVVAALTRDAARGFGAPVPPGELVEALGRVLGAVRPGSAPPGAGPDANRVELELPVPASAVDTERAAVLAHALGWAHDAVAEPGRPPSRLRFVRRDP